MKVNNPNIKIKQRKFIESINKAAEAIHKKQNKKGDFVVYGGMSFIKMIESINL